MKLGTSIIIFLLALVALAAEVFLYFVSGISALAIPDGASSILSVAHIFVLLMILTAAAGILAPVSALIELALKKENIGNYIFAISMFLVLGLYVIGLIDSKNIKSSHDPIETDTSQTELGGPLAREVMEATGKEDDDAEELEEYLEKVRLYDVEAKYYSTYTSDRVAGVNFKLKNEGDRTLRKVKVTFYFMDSTGTVIAEEDYHPVLVTKYSYGDNKPLKPNYIWQNEPGRFYKADSVPSEWQEGLIKADVTEVDFLED